MANTACDAVDGSSTGIATCHIAVSIQKLLMSGVGTKGTKRKSQRDVRKVEPSRSFARKFPVFAIKPTFESTGHLVSS